MLTSDTQGLCDMDTATARLALSIPSHPHYLCVLQGFFGSLLAGLSFSSSEGMRVTLAVHEACANINAHSYQGDTAQHIDLTVFITPQELTVEIRDYGSKPDLTAIQPRALHDVRPGGLGTYFMRSIMDTVTYDVSPDTGTLLRMTKRRSESCMLP